jgi:DNA-binding response OmpR family regulator
MPGIVIIEDDDLMRALMVEWLTAAGYDARASEPPDGSPDDGAILVIVDVYMPRELGAEQLRLARRAHPGVPILAISGHFRPGLACSGSVTAALGVESVLAKPFDRDALLAAVRSVVQPVH